MIWSEISDGFKVIIFASGLCIIIGLLYVPIAYILQKNKPTPTNPKTKEVKE